jgi:hypothetical protein
MDIITTLGIVECLGIIADRAEVASLIWLLEDRSSGILRGIHLKGIWMIWVGLLEDRVTQDNLFEPLDGSGTAGSPEEGHILLR